MTKDNVTKFQRQPCPHCGKPLDSAAPPTSEQSRPPKTGDFCICFGCAQPVVYTVSPLGASLRIPTDDELAEFNVDHGHFAELLRGFLDHRES